MSIEHTNFKKTSSHFYEDFISLFAPSQYSDNKRKKWATYLFSRFVCSKLINDKLFEKNIIILYLSLVKDRKEPIGTDIKDLDPKKKSKVKSILWKLLE